MEKKQELVMILNTNDQPLVAILKTVLDDQKIPYVVKGELLYRNRSLQIMVNREDEEKAFALLRELEKNDQTAH